MNPHRDYGSERVYAQHSWVSKKLALPLQKFVHDKSLGALFLVISALIALVWANSPWAAHYFHFLEVMIPIQIGSFSFSLTAHHWINDGLMALFFLSVGLEIKREFIYGELSQWRKALMPIVAATGGMLFPILFFLLLNRDAEAIHGWAIPVATDIAFALGVLALLGKRVPVEARIFLLTLATADDIGGILIIALFYAKTISILNFALAALLFFIVFLSNRMGLRSPVVYILLGFLSWYFLHASGIHAAIAGVILGLITPAKPKIDLGIYQKEAAGIFGEIKMAIQNQSMDRADHQLGKMEALTLQTESPLNRVARIVDPFVNFAVLPLFALANCGMPLSLVTFQQALSSRVTWGIMLGLLLGKTLGVFVFSSLAARFRIATLPHGITRRHLLGLGVICGIGFTVSLFITDLAYQTELLIADAKIGIFLASLIAAFAGYFILLGSDKNKRTEP